MANVAATTLTVSSLTTAPNADAILVMTATQTLVARKQVSLPFLRIVE
jgi:hypothetical protein